jgi:hypothetical protein
MLKAVSICNQAIHGNPVTREEAEQVINLVNDLNETIATGYSFNFTPNLEYKEQGILCEWEHCIEWMPLPKERNPKSCPVFGHECPGGASRVASCDHTIDETPQRP